MRLKLLLVLLSFLTFLIFTFFSYTVAKELWQRTDFDVTVKIQDRIPRDYDEIFSYFSFLGSAEVTVGLIGVLAVLALLKWKIWAVLGWGIIVPATLVEIFGKLFVFHPSPPVLFQRTIETALPVFYIHTNFSYPSGHMTRTAFLVTIFCIWALIGKRAIFIKLILLVFFLAFALLMALTRVYLGEHWLSDVLGGGLLGVSAGLLSSALILRRAQDQ